MSIKNLRHGVIRIQSGDTVPLEKRATFTAGDLSFTENFPTNVIRDRGKTREITAGDDTPVEWSFSALIEDATLHRTIRDKVWDAFAETVTGLTGGANNLNAALLYAYEQNSFQFATGETGQKLAIGAAPVVDNDFSEELGTADVEGVIRVPKGTGSPGSGGFNVRQPAADTDRDVVYDAVGDATLVTPGAPADCAGGRKTFKLILDLYDVCDPPDPDDFTAGTIERSYVIDNAYLLTDTFNEADEADTISFSGAAIIRGGIPSIRIKLIAGGISQRD